MGTEVLALLSLQAVQGVRSGCSLPLPRICTFSSQLSNSQFQGHLSGAFLWDTSLPRGFCHP